MKKIPANMTHAVVFLGAPYGDNEGGHIQSLHKSYDAAWITTSGCIHEQVVNLDEPYKRTGLTAREYFSG